ncbi:MAG: hypothetical protein ACKOTB_17420, partial [Planctomycetia bacterium]
ILGSMNRSINPQARPATTPARFARPASGWLSLALVLAFGAAFPAAAEDSRSSLERRFLGVPAQVTTGMTKAGEGYFSPDARRICYQAVPEGYPL